MPQDLTDEIEAVAASNADACIRVPQIVQPDIGDAGALADLIPDPLEAHEMPASIAGENVRVTGFPLVG